MDAASLAYTPLLYVDVVLIYECYLLKLNVQGLLIKLESVGVLHWRRIGVLSRCRRNRVHDTHGLSRFSQVSIRFLHIHQVFLHVW